MFKSKFCCRDRSALNEATRSPIFLFQRKVWNLIQIPDGYECPDGEGVYPEREIGEEYDEWHEEHPDPLTWDELHKMKAGDYDVPCAIFHWETDRVFLTREEAENYGRNRHYNYRDGWRVYAVCAEGELEEVLKDGTEMTLKDGE